jgi:hypothetical protein
MKNDFILSKVTVVPPPRMAAIPVAVGLFMGIPLTLMSVTIAKDFGVSVNPMDAIHNLPVTRTLIGAAVIGTGLGIVGFLKAKKWSCESARNRAENYCSHLRKEGRFPELKSFNDLATNEGLDFTVRAQYVKYFQLGGVVFGSVLTLFASTAFDLGEKYIAHRYELNNAIHQTGLMAPPASKGQLSIPYVQMNKAQAHKSSVPSKASLG